MKIKELKQEVWWLMYDASIKEPDYLKGMIVHLTDSWDKKQFEQTYEAMKGIK